MKQIRYALILMFFASTTVKADLLPDFNYDALIKKSDLIVIATPIETKTTDKRIYLFADKNVWLQELISKFTVKAKFKGECDTTIDVLHFELKFRAGATTALDSTYSKLSFKNDEQKASEMRGYMLFLNTEKGKQYSLVTGRNHPQYSVRELKVPKTD